MPRATPVRSVMTTEVLSFRPEEPIRDATERLVERGIDGGPVIDESGHVIGMLTDDAVLVQETRLHYPTVISLFGAYLELPSSHRRFEEDLKRAVGATVGDVMERDVVTCSEDDTLERAATIMHEHGASRLPVVRDGRLVGIIGRGDVIRAIVLG
jgi:CBS domain-containing protein